MNAPLHKEWESIVYIHITFFLKCTLWCFRIRFSFLFFLFQSFLHRFLFFQKMDFMHKVKEKGSHFSLLLFAKLKRTLQCHTHISHFELGASIRLTDMLGLSLKAKQSDVQFDFPVFLISIIFWQLVEKICEHIGTIQRTLMAFDYFDGIDWVSWSAERLIYAKQNWLFQSCKKLVLIAYLHSLMSIPSLLVP